MSIKEGIIMEFHSFGSEEKRVIVLLHAFGTSWRMWQDEIEGFMKDYHVIAVALEGHEDDKRITFTTVENNANKVIDYLMENGINEVFAICGVSLGGAVAVSMLAQKRIKVKKAIIDAGIIPENNSGISEIKEVCSNLLMMWFARRNINLLKLFINPEDYRKKQIENFHSMIRSISWKTAKNVFCSVDTYLLNNDYSDVTTEIYYWYGSKEEKERKRGAEIVASKFPNVKIKKFEGYNHAQLYLGNPKLFLKCAYEFFEN